MPFYRWDDMKKRNIVPTTDSEGSMILGAGEVVHIPLGVEHELKNQVLTFSYICLSRTDPKTGHREKRLQTRRKEDNPRNRIE